MRYLTIHASATPPEMDIGAEEITRWHLERGFNTIGYHEVIKRDGTVQMGRPVYRTGAHVGGHNTGNYGICLVGGINNTREKKPEDNFTEAQWTALRARMTAHHARWPEAVIMGHNGFPGHESRGCPCFDWRKWRDEFLAGEGETPSQLPSHWLDEVDTDGGMA